MTDHFFSRGLAIPPMSRDAEHRRAHPHGRIRSAFACFVALALANGEVGAAEDPAADRGQPIQSLDEQVQEIKSDVLSIAAELGNLEEKLLYPSDSQLAVFVSVAKGEPVEVDSARITVDGQLVAQHVYSWKELQALAQGGVQRIHTGNVTTGKHQLEVAVTGRRGADKTFEVVERYDFSKEVGPRKIGIRLAHGTTGGATVKIEAW